MADQKPGRMSAERRAEIEAGLRKWGTVEDGFFLDAAEELLAELKAVEAIAKRAECASCGCICDPRENHTEHNPCACDIACDVCYPATAAALRRTALRDLAAARERVRVLEEKALAVLPWLEDLDGLETWNSHRVSDIDALRAVLEKKP